jgi:hypothetical protein
MTDELNRRIEALILQVACQMGWSAVYTPDIEKRKSAIFQKIKDEQYELTQDSLAKLVWSMFDTAKYQLIVHP